MLLVNFIVFTVCLVWWAHREKRPDGVATDQAVKRSLWLLFAFLLCLLEALHSRFLIIEELIKNPPQVEQEQEIDDG